MTERQFLIAIAAMNHGLQRAMGQPCRGRPWEVLLFIDLVMTEIDLGETVESDY